MNDNTAYAVLIVSIVFFIMIDVMAYYNEIAKINALKYRIERLEEVVVSMVNGDRK